MDTPAKVLLVDDEPGVRESVQAYLQYGDDFEVRTASNANEAWDLLNQEIPELVISDIMMPQVDGYQFLKKLREDARFQTIPVVFLTARGMTSDRIQGYNAGCDAYLSKPFDPEELEALIKSLIERRRDVKRCASRSTPTYQVGSTHRHHQRGIGRECEKVQSYQRQKDQRR